LSNRRQKRRPPKALSPRHKGGLARWMFHTSSVEFSL